MNLRVRCDRWSESAIGSKAGKPGSAKKPAVFGAKDTPNCHKDAGAKPSCDNLLATAFPDSGAGGPGVLPTHGKLVLSAEPEASVSARLLTNTLAPTSHPFGISCRSRTVR